MCTVCSDTFLSEPAWTFLAIWATITGPYSPMTLHQCAFLGHFDRYWTLQCRNTPQDLQFWKCSPSHVAITIWPLDVDGACGVLTWGTQFTGLKGPVAKLTCWRGYHSKPSGCCALMGQGCFGNKSGTNIILSWWSNVRPLKTATHTHISSPFSNFINFISIARVSQAMSLSNMILL